MLVFNKNILTIGGNRLEGESLTPPEPGPLVLPTVIEPNYNQYCWVIPIDIFLNSHYNHLKLEITAYTTVTGSGAWDSDRHFYAERINYTNELSIVYGVNSFEPIDSNGYRGMTINYDRWDYVSGSNRETIQSWKDTYGESNMLLHAPSSQSNKFLSPPTCIMTYDEV